MQIKNKKENNQKIKLPSLCVRKEVR